MHLRKTPRKKQAAEGEFLFRCAHDFAPSRVPKLFYLNHSGCNTRSCQIRACGTFFHWETAAWLIPNSLARSRCEPTN